MARPGAVLANGEVRMFLRSADEAEKCLRRGCRCRWARGRWSRARHRLGRGSLPGVWNVTAGQPGPIIGCGEAGKIVLKWPAGLGGKLEEKTVAMMDEEPVSVVLEAKK